MAAPLVIAASLFVAVALSAGALGLAVTPGREDLADVLIAGAFGALVLAALLVWWRS